MLQRPLWVLVAGQIMARNPLSLRGVMDAVYLMAKKRSILTGLPFSLFQMSL
jgi:tetrahydromethanopterin S-methyltransferase subunit E